MKKHIVSIILAVLALACPAVAQVTPTEHLVRIQTDPESGRVQAFYEKRIILDGTTTKLAGWQEVSWALADTAEVPITLANGQQATTTRAAIFAAVLLIAHQEKAKADAPPAPPSPSSP